MRKFVIAAVLAASALTVAAPAAAQWYPPQPQGYGYGYYDNYGQVRRLQARIDQLQRQIDRLDRRDILSKHEARRLRDESRGLEFRLQRAARYGLNGRERFEIERGIQRLEYRIAYEARDGNRYAYGNGHDGWWDREKQERWYERPVNSWHERHDNDDHQGDDDDDD